MSGILGFLLFRFLPLYLEGVLMNKLEELREVRLWMKQIILPALGIAAIYFSDEDRRSSFTERWLKRSTRKKIRKEL